MPPNVVVILADDLGYGDLAANDPACRIPTPSLDRLCERGMRFTDMHASSAICTPSRYSLLTGRYNWRSRLERGIVWEWDAPVIEPATPTIATSLRERGYTTACIGKWHLGWDWATLDGRAPNDTLPWAVRDDEVAARRRAYSANVDFAARIGGGPVDRGFDSYFGVDVPNFAPYAWFEDDRLSGLPTDEKPDTMYGEPGPMVPGWSLEAMIPELTRRAVRFVEEHARGDPWFLYFPLTSPHSPVVPNREFHGRSGIGAYGDFVCEVDWVAGQIVAALERTGQAEETLVVFTSDNGPEVRTPDDEGAYERARRSGHFSMGRLRGVKRDVWEGGHRVPFVASWPGVVPKGSVCRQTACLLDLFATVVDLAGAPLPSEAEDSVSLAPLLRGETDAPVRECLVHHSAWGTYAIREGNWVYVDAPLGGHVPEPEWFRELRGYAPHEQRGELFDLAADLPQRANAYAERPEVVERLAARLAEIRRGPVTAAAPGEHLSE